MDNDKTLKTGIIGACVMAVCCFTPALVLVFGALGLGAWVSGLDFILLPLLALFLCMIGFALYRRRQASQDPT